MANVQAILPDFRHYLLSFNHTLAIQTYMHGFGASSLSATDTSTDSLRGVLDSGSYRQYGWAMSAYSVALAALLALLFLFQVCWRVCCFSCGCRKRDPTKQAKIYSQLTKIFWGSLMFLFLAVGAAAAVLAFLMLHSSVVPVSESVRMQLDNTVYDMAQFRKALVSPLTEMLAIRDDNVAGLRSFVQFQEAATLQMAPHTFLENQTYQLDLVRQPVFAILEKLRTYTSLYPTVMDPQTNCSSLGIAPNVVVRMTVGATTGCFRCKECSTMMELVARSSDLWIRNPFQVQMDLLVSQRQLQAFGASKASLEPALAQFHDRTDASCSVFMETAAEVASRYEKLRSEVYTITYFGLLGLVGLSVLATVVGVAGVVLGLRSNKRATSRTACFVAEIACALAIILTGVLYSVATMALDGIETLKVFNASSSAFFASEQVATDIRSILFDVNLVNASGWFDMFAVADTLRVPPHPTPTNDTPGRVDIPALYNSVFTDLFALELTANDTDSALVTLFGWDDSFVATQRSVLLATAFGNASVTSPYNQSIHQTLLNSSVTHLLDPDNDAVFMTPSDVAEVVRVFNETWRGVDDRGVYQNWLIVEQWRSVAQLCQQRLRLGEYTAAVASVISSTRPLLGKSAVRLAHHPRSRSASHGSLTLSLVSDPFVRSQLSSSRKRARWRRQSLASKAPSSTARTRSAPARSVTARSTTIAVRTRHRHSRNSQPSYLPPSSRDLLG